MPQEKTRCGTGRVVDKLLVGIFPPPISLSARHLQHDVRWLVTRAEKGRLNGRAPSDRVNAVTSTRSEPMDAQVIRLVVAECPPWATGTIVLRNEAGELVGSGYLKRTGEATAEVTFFASLTALIPSAAPRQTGATESPERPASGTAP